jgi:hypothetical protein
MGRNGEVKCFIIKFSSPSGNLPLYDLSHQISDLFQWFFLFRANTT